MHTAWHNVRFYKEFLVLFTSTVTTHLLIIYAYLCDFQNELKAPIYRNFLGASLYYSRFHWKTTVCMYYRISWLNVAAFFSFLYSWLDHTREVAVVGDGEQCTSQEIRSETLVSMQLTGNWGSHEWELPCRPQIVTPKCIGVWRTFTILAGFPGKKPLNLKKHFLHSQCPWKKKTPRVYLKALIKGKAGFWGVAQWRRCRGYEFMIS